MKAGLEIGNPENNKYIEPETGFLVGNGAPFLKCR